MSNLKAIDLFCGAGGASLGLVQAGIDVVGAVEAEDAPIKTYEHNLCNGDLDEYPGSVTFNSPLQADLSRGRSDEYADLPAVDFFDICDHFDIEPEDVDLICGCPPCQSYSSLRDTEPWDETEPKDLLLQTYVGFIQEAKPDIVLFENVPGILTAGGDKPTTYIDWFLKKMKLIRRTGDPLEDAGYGKDFRVVNAADFGIPQERKRTIGLFVYGAEDDQVNLPKPTHDRNPDRESALEDWVTVEDTILDQNTHKIDLELGETQVDVDGYLDDPAHRARRHNSRTMERAKAIRMFGDSWRDLIGTDYDYLIEDCHNGLEHGANSAYGIMAKDKPAPTLTTKCTTISSGRFTHPTQNRSITLREAAMLMTFPNWFGFPCPHGDSETVIGNAVPPKLLESLLSPLIKVEAQETQEQGIPVNQVR